MESVNIEKSACHVAAVHRRLLPFLSSAVVLGLEARRDFQVVSTHFVNEVLESVQSPGLGFLTPSFFPSGVPKKGW